MNIRNLKTLWAILVDQLGMIAVPGSCLDKVMRDVESEMFGPPDPVSMKAILVDYTLHMAGKRNLSRDEESAFRLVQQSIDRDIETEEREQEQAVRDILLGKQKR